MNEGRNFQKLPLHKNGDILHSNKQESNIPKLPSVINVEMGPQRKLMFTRFN